MTIQTLIPKIDHPEQGGLIAGAWMDKVLRAQLVARLEATDFVGPDRTLMTALASMDGEFNYLVAESKLNDKARERLTALQAALAIKPELKEFNRWIRKIEDESVLRQMAAALEQVKGEIKPGADPAKLMGRVVTTLVKINARAVNEVKTIDDAVDAALEFVDGWEKGEKYKNAIPTGFANLDRILGGLKRGHVSTLAARPSRGKTQLALQILRNVAQRIKIEKRDAVVVMYSAEMTDAELALRLAQAASGVSASWLREGELPGPNGRKVTELDRKKFRAELEKLRELQPFIRIIDSASPTTAQMYREVAAQKALHKDGVDLMVFDYLELAGDTGGKGANETNRIGSIMRGLKAIAKDHKCNVLNIAQLNRGVESRADRWADLPDLRQSGDIEALSEQVMFIDYPEFYHSAVKGWDTNEVQKRGAGYAAAGHNASIYVAKNRGGKARVGARMNFTPEITRFEEHQVTEINAAIAAKEGKAA